jgi:hypothetical protein
MGAAPRDGTNRPGVWRPFAAWRSCSACKDSCRSQDSAALAPVDENLTVLDGKLVVGRGHGFDASKLAVMELGDFIQMRAMKNHYTRAQTDVIIRLHGMGRFAIIFVNRADDQRLKE